MEQVFQVTGSLLVLVPFALVQTGRLSTNALSYLISNLAGSGILAVNAGVTAEWGFLLLEGVWALVSLAGVVRALRGQHLVSGS